MVVLKKAQILLGPVVLGDGSLVDWRFNLYQNLGGGKGGGTLLSYSVRILPFVVFLRKLSALDLWDFTGVSKDRRVSTLLIWAWSW